MRISITLVAVTAISLCSAPAANAHIMSVIDYQELRDKSDLIAIACPVTKTTDTKEKTFFPDIVQQSRDGKQSKVPAIGVETIFSVSVVLKGDFATKKFVLHHYREAPSSPEIISVGGPLVVSFVPPDRPIQPNLPVQLNPPWCRNILLFLIKEHDGRYAPTGGQTDPSGRAIYALEPPPYPSGER